MKKIYFIPVFVLVIVFSFLFFMKDIKGANRDYDLIYAPVEIEHGDNLWSISEEYNDPAYYTDEEYIAMVSEINNINADDIKSGTMLILPMVCPK